MNTHFRRFEMLALQTMASDAFKDDVNNANVMFLEEFDDVLRICRFVRRKSILCRTLGL